MLRILLTVAALSTVAVSKKKPSNKEHEDFPGATDEDLIMGHPAAIKAKKMARLTKKQDVVSTCRYILFKEKKNFWDARNACKNVIWPFTHKGIWLADVHTEEENTDIRVLLQVANGIQQVEDRYHRMNWVWIGLEN